jgi:transposase
MLESELLGIQLSWGAARVEDTYDLLGHTLRKALGVMARKPRRRPAEIATQADASLLGSSSLKAALDCDWDDPSERAEALAVVLATLTTVECALVTKPEGREEPAVQRSLAAAHQVKQQDVEISEVGAAELREDVAKDRRISIEDTQMRHGRKSRRVRVDGYKRHVLSDLDTGRIRAVGMTPADVAEDTVTEAIAADLHAQQVMLEELHIDRA